MIQEAELSILRVGCDPCHTDYRQPSAFSWTWGHDRKSANL